MVQILHLFKYQKPSDFQQNFLDCKYCRSKKRKKYCFNISGTDNDILKIPMDLNSVGSRAVSCKNIIKIHSQIKMAFKKQNRKRIKS